MEMKFLSELDKDTVDNLSENTKAILVDNNYYWIEILNDGSFYVPDGWIGFVTKEFWEAYKYYQEIKSK